MLDQALTLPDDPEELRSSTARLLAEVKAQAILIEKLRHQLAGHRAHRFGASSETAEQLQLALETMRCSGFRSASSRLTIWLRRLLADRLTEYGSVTRLVSTAPVLGAKTVTS